MRRRPRIVIVGGGSYGWTPLIVRDMLLKETLSDAEYVLYDVNRQASDFLKTFLEALASKLQVGPRIVSTDDARLAFRNANYVAITISTGGLQAMRRDLEIPEEYGVYHTVGDTCGPGGWARFIRNFDAFRRLAESFHRYCPEAYILNYSNPMATITDLLCRMCKAPVIGLCHGYDENLRFLKAYYRLSSSERIELQYGGVNHFFWVTGGRAGTVDILPDLRKQIRKKTLEDMAGDLGPDAMGWKSNRAIATELFRKTGFMPYLGDRHICEFFPWYITKRKTMKQYRLERTPIEERQEWQQRRKTNLKRMLRNGIDDSYTRRSGETAAEIILALMGEEPFSYAGNVPNRGQISNLPAGAIVETAVRSDGKGFTPLPFGELPEVILPWVEIYTRINTLLVDACMQGNRELALHALRLDPVCSHLTTPEVDEMGKKLLRAHRKYIRIFES